MPRFRRRIGAQQCDICPLDVPIAFKAAGPRNCNDTGVKPTISHRSRWTLVVACAIGTATLIYDGHAQDATFTSDVKVVSLLATVRNSSGAIVKDLTKDDFRLTDNGRRETIRYFSRVSDLPLTVALLVDTSRSMLAVLPKEAQATVQFFAQVLRPGEDSAEVLHFDGAIDVLQTFTSSREELTAALAQLGTPALGEYSEGRLYDAVRYATESMPKKRDGRKAIILLSDGMDTVRSPRTTLATAIESSQRADTTIFTILVDDGPDVGNRKRCVPTPCKAFKRGKRSSGDPNRGPGVMSRLAQETGGGFFKISRASPIEQIYAQIEDELRSQYSIAFTPDQIDASGKYRRLKLTTVQNGLTVQTRDGYYPR